MTEKLPDNNPEKEHYQGTPVMAITGVNKFMDVYLPPQELDRILRVGMVKAAPFTLIFGDDVPKGTEIRFSDLLVRYESMGEFNLN